MILAVLDCYAILAARPVQLMAVLLVLVNGRSSEKEVPSARNPGHPNHATFTLLPRWGVHLRPRSV